MGSVIIVYVGKAINVTIDVLNESMRAKKVRETDPLFRLSTAWQRLPPPRRPCRGKTSHKEADILMMLAAEVHLGTKSCDFQMEPYVLKRRNGGVRKLLLLPIMESQTIMQVSVANSGRLKSLMLSGGADAAVPPPVAAIQASGWTESGTDIRCYFLSMVDIS